MKNLINKTTESRSTAAVPYSPYAERERYFRRNFLYATEMRPWLILEAFAERISRLGAHRSSWRNGISEEVPLSFGSHSLSLGSVP